MQTLFAALSLIVAAGIVPLLLPRWFSWCRLTHLALLTAGCLTGLYGALAALYQGQMLRFAVPWLQSFTLALSLDSLAAAFLVPVFLVPPLIGLYGFGYLNQPQRAWRTAVSQCFFSLLIAAMILVVLAANMLSFGLAWELMSLSSFFLVLHDWDKNETREAAYLYLLFTQGGALLIFAAFGVLAGATATFSFADLGQVPQPVKLTAFFLALAGFGSKAGVIGLHTWLPHAHPAAPSHVSALMSGVMIKMGVYGILRLCFLLGGTEPVFHRTLMVLGLVSGLLGVISALGKHDIKRLLAYHSIENIGIILIGCGLGLLGLASGNPTMAACGFAGGLLHVLNHALFKSLLFMGAGAVLKATGIRTIDRLGGLMKTMPVTGRTFLAGSVAISGLPPFNGFVSEFLIYFAAFQGLRLPGTDFLLAMAAIVGLAVIGGLAAACFTKVVGTVFLGEPRSAELTRATEVGGAMRAAMIALASACLLIGLWPEPCIRLALLGARDLLPQLFAGDLLGPIPAHLGLAARLFVGLLAAVTLLLRLLYRNKPVTAGPTWGCGFTQASGRLQYTGTSYARSMVEFHRPFIRVRTKYDGISRIFPDRTRYTQKVADLTEIGLMRLIRPLLGGVAKLRFIQHGQIQLYIGYIIFTIALLLLVLQF